MEEDNYKYISLSDSELSMVDEGIYTNIPTAEIDIDMSPEYSPTTEPIYFSSSIKNYLPSQPSSPIQNQIDEAPLTLPIEYLSAARDWLISMMSEHSSNEANTSSLPIQLSTSTVNFTLPTNETESGLQLEDWISQPSSPSQNQIDEAPLTLPIEYLSAARDWLISMVMMSEHSSNEANTSSLPIQLSTSTVNFTLPTDETESRLQLEDWISQPLYEMPLPIITENPSLLSTPSLPIVSTNQTLFTTNRNTNIGYHDDIIFNDIDQIINHNRRWINGHRVMSMLCKLKDGEQRWISTGHLRKDSRVSSLVDRYYRDLKHPYWAKRSSRNKTKGC